MTARKEASSEVRLAVHRYSAWSPGVTDMEAWREWALGMRSLVRDRTSPSVPFVEPLQRRRLSRATKMALAVAWYCLADESENPMVISCSRYGEFPRTFGILQNLGSGQTVSPMIFSQSVHNTAAATLAIIRANRSSSSAVASGADTLEAGFIDAWSALQTADAPSVLLVYFDEVLPTLYAEQETSVRHSAAIGLLLRRPHPRQTVPSLRLAWRDSTDTSAGAVADDPPLNVLRLLLVGGDPVTVDTGRVRWTWTFDDAND
ncbi:MAG TPA: beta-ketoacyl synthase chain length factor [Defluviicoccus sp.]|nr:beta-ketoacyl synthase chain length factor [Defluviicoccus sp.]